MNISEERQSELLTALKSEEEEALGYLQSELEEQQIDAMRRYYGEPYGDEIEGRSTVVSRDLYETIEWIRPDLVRLFASGGRICDLEGSTAADDGWANDAADYLNFVLFEDNEGVRILDAFAFDGLLMRRGYVAAYWRDAEHDKPIELTGLTSQQADQLTQDPRYVIEEQAVEEMEPSQEYPDGYTYSFKLRPVRKRARIEVVNVAPEDMRVSARTIELDEARYVGRVLRMMRGEAKRLFPDHADEIDDRAGGADDTLSMTSEERRAERFRDQENWVSRADSSSDEAQEIEILEEYLRFDANADEYPELLRIYRMGDYLLEVEEVDEHPFASWTPTPIPHRHHGLSIHDALRDIQRIKTVAIRAGLDAMYQAVAPRVVAGNKVNLDDLLVVRPGAVIRTDHADAAGQVVPLVTPDLTPSALNMIEYVDQAQEKRTGVSRNAQGMDPDSLNKTARGIQLMQNASSARKEQYARNMAIGLQQLLRKMYKLLVRNQDTARTVKIAGKWRDMNPGDWHDDVRVRVHVGLGTGARETQLAMLQQVMGMQTAYIERFGASTPVVTLRHMYETAEEMCRVMGYRSADRFFSEPPPDYAPPENNPEAGKAQAEMQMRAQELQMKQQEAAAKLQLEAQRAQAQLQSDERKTAAQIEADREKQAADFEMKRQQLEMEFALKREQMAAELQLKREQMAAELGLQREQMQLEASVRREVGMAGAAAKPKANGSAANMQDIKLGGELG